MRALAVLFAGNLTEYAFAPLSGTPGGERCAFDLALEGARALPGVERRVLLARTGLRARGDIHAPDAAQARLPADVGVIEAENWTVRATLEAVSRESAGFDLCWFAWADAPFPDAALAARLADRHLRYAAEYSYADGWPYGFAPEILAPGVAGILAKIAAAAPDGGEIPVSREMLFQTIQKDINAFDIETELSPEDQRQYRLSFTCDSRRNWLLCRRFAGHAGGDPAALSAEGAAAFVREKTELLRTLPAWYAVQAADACPQDCALCPWPDCRPAGEGRFLELVAFEKFLDRVVEFSGDAVIGLSLWGELALHPQKLALIGAVLERPSLSLVIETSALGWRKEELERIAEMAAEKTREPFPWAAPAVPLSWIVSLDAATESRYREIRGEGFAEAVETAKLLVRLFPGAAWVQALRVKGAEDDTERFYRQWKEIAGADQVIIQKYDDFAGARPKLQGADLSPVLRRPCWHLMRDISVLLDGSVPWCREDLRALAYRAAGDPAGWGMGQQAADDPGALRGAGPPAGGVAGDPRSGAPAQGGAPPSGSLLDLFRGNIFVEGPEAVWERGAELCRNHCAGVYPDVCAGCDEYYTFNF